MKPTPDQIRRGLAASYALRDQGDPAAGLKPVSFTASPSAHVEAILEAVLGEEPQLVPQIVRAWRRSLGGFMVPELCLMSDGTFMRSSDGLDWTPAASLTPLEDELVRRDA
jgi:hypothetical protein